MMASLLLLLLLLSKTCHFKNDSVVNILYVLFEKEILRNLLKHITILWIYFSIDVIFFFFYFDIFIYLFSIF